MASQNEDENSLEFWTTKSHKLEKVIKTLSNHCVRVVEKYEDLLVKFDKNKRQYKRLKGKFQEKEEQIKKAKEVLVPISTELKTLREKYEIAVRCQVEAESYAVKTVNKNKELRRQSQMIGAKLGTLNIVDINIDFDDTPVEENEEQKEYIEKLGQQIDELEEQKSSLTVSLKDMAENYECEKERNEKLNEKIKQNKEEIKTFKTIIKEQEEVLKHVETTSEKAYKEYDKMEQTYKKEFVVRNEAERFAQKLLTERNQARRESALALSKVSNDAKLSEAMLQIQDLNTNTAKLKEDYDKKICELEEQLRAAKELYRVEGLDLESEEQTQEMDLMQEKLLKSEGEIKRLNDRYTSLEEAYKTLESKYEYATKAPPPPPPPAPPPPIVPSKSGGFLQKIVGRKGQRERAKEKLKKGGVETNDTHTKAVEEMMKRIQSGNIGLRPVLQKQSKSQPEKETSAMMELQGLLSKMKKSRSDDELSVIDDTGVDETSELGKLLIKRQQAIKENTSSPQKDATKIRPVPQPRKLSVVNDGDEEI